MEPQKIVVSGGVASGFGAASIESEFRRTLSNFYAHRLKSQFPNSKQWEARTIVREPLSMWLSGLLWPSAGVICGAMLGSVSVELPLAHAVVQKGGDAGNHR